MHKVLITKPMNREQEALASEYGLHVFIQTFIKVTLEYDTIIPPKADVWIFTSSNATKYISAHAPDIPKDVWPNHIVAIGQATAHHIKHLGVPVHVPEYAIAERVIEKVKELNAKSAVFFSGNLRRNVIPEALRDEIDFYEFQVYQTELLDVPLDLSEIEAIAFFSPSGVRGFAKSNTIWDQKVVAVGTSTKQAVQEILNITAKISASASMEDVLFALKEDLVN